MKNKHSILILIFSCLFTYTYGQNRKIAQSNPLPTQLNEVKINAAYAFFHTIEVSYERVIPSANSSAGAFLLFTLANNSEEVKYISPYYRLFFGEHVGKGFFLEMSGVIGRDEDEPVDIGLALSIGAKFIRNQRLVVDPFLGIGKTITDNSYWNIFPKVGVNMGYAF